MMIIPTISDLPAASECVMNVCVLFVLLNILHLETVFVSGLMQCLGIYVILTGKSFRPRIEYFIAS